MNVELSTNQYVKHVAILSAEIKHWIKNDLFFFLQNIIFYINLLITNVLFFLFTHNESPTRAWYKCPGKTLQSVENRFFHIFISQTVELRKYFLNDNKRFDYFFKLERVTYRWAQLDFLNAFELASELKTCERFTRPLVQFEDWSS